MIQRMPLHSRRRRLAASFAVALDVAVTVDLAVQFMAASFGWAQLPLD